MPTERYENLPGVQVNYEDGNLFTGNRELAANTQSLLLIGTAVDGPVGEPVSVREIGVREAENLFGSLVDRRTKRPHDATLVRSMYEAIEAGNEDVRLLRISGRSAKTELKAKDLGRILEQFLDYADGNTAFDLTIQLPEDSVFVGINKVEELEADGNVKSINVNSVVDRVDQDNHKVFFYADKMRPGNTVRVHYEYEQRDYTLVPAQDEQGNPDYSDPDYTLTQDVNNDHYFYSSRKNWSDQLISGHIPIVTIKDNQSGNAYTINSTDPSGNYIYRVGKGQVDDPLQDPWSEQDYKDGGIFFTSAYDARVETGEYPDLNGDITVYCEYAYYQAVVGSDVAEKKIPGVAVDYTLEYKPTADEFSVYYVQGGQKVELQEGKDYSLSIANMTVTLTAGAAPVGAQLFASYKTSSVTDKDPVLVVEGKYPGEVYGSLEDRYDKSSIRGVSVQIYTDPDPSNVTGEEKVIVFKKPEEKRLTYNDHQLIYQTAKMPQIKTLRQFINYVNNDPANNVVELSSEYGDVPVQGLIPTDGEIFLGQEAPGVLKEDPIYPIEDARRYPWLGDNGIFDITSHADMQEMYDLLGGKYEVDSNGNPQLVEQGIYNRLENYVVDVIVLLDAYADTVIDPLMPDKNFATQLAQHCAIVSSKTWETLGVIGVSPAKNASLLGIQEHIDNLTKEGVNEHYMYNEATHDQILNSEGDRIDIGRYIQVVFGPEIGLYNDKIGSYVTSGATVYAALITTLSPEVATTNKEVGVVQGLRYNLSEAQHNQLVGGRYVTFQRKTVPTNSGLVNQIVVKDGVTAALPNSDYNRLSTMRIVFSTIQMIRRRAEPFIGLPNGIAQQNALSAEIQAGLDRLKENGVLQGFQFTIFSSAQDKVIGNAMVNLELVPAFELRKIVTNVALRASL